MSTARPRQQVVLRRDNKFFVRVCFLCVDFLGWLIDIMLVGGLVGVVWLVWLVAWSVFEPLSFRILKPNLARLLCLPQWMRETLQPIPGSSGGDRFHDFGWVLKMSKPFFFF